MRILLVDGDDQYAERMSRMIRAACPAGVELTRARTPAEATPHLNAGTFDVCFVEYAFETHETGLDLLRLHHHSSSLTAFAILTDTANKDFAFQALTQGATDYLIKSRFTEFELAKCIAYSMYMKRREVGLQTEALKDSLTGLGNRALFDAQMLQAAQRAARDQEKLGLLIIDLDQFKPLNDRYGHPFGDKVLCQVAERIIEETRASDVLARIGGDEFAAILIRPTSMDQVDLVAEKIERAITQMPYAIDGRAVKLGCSVGSAILPDDTSELDALIALADQRMYKHKNVKKVTYPASRDYIDAILR